MNKTKIEWCDYTWNPITGCKRDCFYCYAKKMRHRFYPEVKWSDLMLFDERWDEPLKVKKPTKIFVGSMSDICYWRNADIHNLIHIVRCCPQHTFQLLTKDYSFYDKWVFPENCWLGITVEQPLTYGNARKVGGFFRHKGVRFISYEPLLFNPRTWDGIDWIIVGAMTGQLAKMYPVKREWIQNIINQTRNANIPLFIKDNVKWHEKIQEFPK